MAVFKKFPDGVYHAVSHEKRKRKIFLGVCTLVPVWLVKLGGFSAWFAFPAAFGGFALGVYLINRFAR
jgi:hypothetical protein